MKSKSYLICTALAATLVVTVSVASSADAAIVYNVDQTIGGGSVVGTITTDGGTGVLAASDITAWNLELTGVGASYSLKNTDTDSAVVVVGGDLTATTHDLYFNFEGTTGDYFLLQDNLYSGQTYYCNSIGSTACLPGKSDVPQYYGASTSTYDSSASGNQIIGVAAVPEPAGWALMLVGIGGLGAAMRGRRRKQILAVA